VRGTERGREIEFVTKQNTAVGAGDERSRRRYLYMTPPVMIIFKLNKLIQSFLLTFNLLQVVSEHFLGAELVEVQPWLMVQA
jgi:hypothetical protein